MLKEFQAPYALVTVLVLLVTAVALMAQGSVDSTAFKVGAVLAGGFVARAALAVSVGALNTAVVMVGGSMVLLLAAVFLLHAETFKDHAIEGPWPWGHSPAPSWLWGNSWNGIAGRIRKWPESVLLPSVQSR